jgi:hypothetical protein
MALMHFSELSKTLVALPLADRIAAMEVLWGTLDKVADQARILPEHHKSGLERGLADIAAGRVISWAEAKQQLSRLGKT